VLGVNVEEGVAYLAVVDAPGRARLDLADRLIPPAELDPAERLAAFTTRVTRELHHLRVGGVAVARPIRHTDWRYAEAFTRASIETCFTLAAHALSLSVDFVGQHHAANLVGMTIDNVADTLPARLEIRKTPQWAHRCPAVLVALAVALQTPAPTADPRAEPARA
jgi:hypothetical protein